MTRRIVIRDTEYSVTAAYIEGALAVQAGIPWTHNPFRDDSEQAQEWSYGHENEADGQHDAPHIRSMIGRHKP